MFADDLMRIDRAYALDSAFAKEIHRTVAQGRKGGARVVGQEADFRDPNRNQRHTGQYCGEKDSLMRRAAALRAKLRQELKEEYARG